MEEEDDREEVQEGEEEERGGRREERGERREVGGEEEGSRGGGEGEEEKAEEREGMEWSGVEWNGMEWSGMEWNGMIEVEWTGVEPPACEDMTQPMPRKKPPRTDRKNSLPREYFALYRAPSTNIWSTSGHGLSLLQFTAQLEPCLNKNTPYMPQYPLTP